MAAEELPPSFENMLRAKVSKENVAVIANYVMALKIQSFIKLQL
ncbi:MAG: hypothetical protein WAM14_01515 [Candidatus Nitrosopolaris sp.]